MFDFLNEINKLITIYASLNSTHNNNRRLGAMVAFALPRNFYTTTMDFYDSIVNTCKNAIKIINKMDQPEDLKTKIISKCEGFIKLTKEDKNYRTRKKNLHITIHRETNFSDNNLYRNLVNMLFNDMSPLNVTIKGGKWVNYSSGDMLYVLEFDDNTISNIQKQIDIYTYNYNKAQEIFGNKNITPRKINQGDFTHITVAKYSPEALKAFPNMVRFVLQPLENVDKIFKGKTFTCEDLYMYFLNKTVVYNLNTRKHKVETGI